MGVFASAAHQLNWGKLLLLLDLVVPCRTGTISWSPSCSLSQLLHPGFEFTVLLHFGHVALQGTVMFTLTFCHGCWNTDLEWEWLRQGPSVPHADAAKSPALMLQYLAHVWVCTCVHDMWTQKYAPIKQAYIHKYMHIRQRHRVWTCITKPYLYM